MPIFKKFLNVVKKIFSGSRRKKSVKKNSKRVTKKKTVSVKKRKIVKAPAKKSLLRPSRKTSAVSKKNKSVLKETKPVGPRVGAVTHYFDRIKVCVIRVDQGQLKTNDRLLIKGSRGELTQKINSMQIENQDVSAAKKGQLIGLKVTKPVFEGDEVFKIL